LRARHRRLLWEHGERGWVETLGDIERAPGGKAHEDRAGMRAFIDGVSGCLAAAIPRRGRKRG
jgi:hypothetical protein